jgi:hypothetical protein
MGERSTTKLGTSYEGGGGKVVKSSDMDSTPAAAVLVAVGAAIAAMVADVWVLSTVESVEFIYGDDADVVVGVADDSPIAGEGVASVKCSNGTLIMTSSGT